ncbi:MAG: CO2 hydration protein [Synechococcaceae cyanobacterium RL_1_2]|nr:CO2 hydration protein [Synechococcaceae cyanobacterium RL_1_2]
MVTSPPSASRHPLGEFVQRLEAGEALLKDSPHHVMEVVGILKSYGVVLDAYSINLCYVADHQFLTFFPFFKYLNGQVNRDRLVKHWWHDRINYEYAEYCMRGMMWHGGGALDSYIEQPKFIAACDRLIAHRFKGNPLVRGVHKLLPELLRELLRQSVYHSALGQFWRVMSDMFLSLSDRYDAGEITTIPDVVQHILDGLVADAARPIIYEVEWKGEKFSLIPESEGITFLMDTAVPYVEAIFFRGAPFPGTISYNAQAGQIPNDQGAFTYGALFADPLPIGGAGIPPTLLMQDMRHYLPDYLLNYYRQGVRGEGDLLIKICESFQKSMYCVTTAAIKGLAPHPLDTTNPQEQVANRKYLETWMNRFMTSQIKIVNA